MFRAFLYTIPAKTKAGAVKCFAPDVFTDSGANYTGENGLGAWWISPWEPFYFFIFRHRIKAPHLKKRMRAIFFNGSGEIIPLVGKDFGSNMQQTPGVVGNTPETEPQFPVKFTKGNEIWAPENENEGVWAPAAGVEDSALWAGGAETGQVRIYALGTENVWAVGFGNNSAEPFEIDAYTYLAQFRKS